MQSKFWSDTFKFKVGGPGVPGGPGGNGGSESQRGNISIFRQDDTTEFKWYKALQIIIATNFVF